MVLQLYSIDLLKYIESVPIWLVISVLIFIVIFTTIAFKTGRAVTFWPPSIGAKIPKELKFKETSISNLEMIEGHRGYEKPKRYDGKWSGRAFDLKVDPVNLYCKI